MSVVELAPVAVTPAGDVRLEAPVGWVVAMGPPAVVHPAGWAGEPPAIVVSAESDGFAGDDLMLALVGAALGRLTDPLIVGAWAGRDEVEIVLAHRHRGLDVTTVERHFGPLGPRGVRWVVAMSVGHDETIGWLPLARRVVGSLSVVSG
ncbi:MAG TPA: hypothetical protein VGJ43_01025 [Acidimicrobiales bacterium]